MRPFQTLEAISALDVFQTAMHAGREAPRYLRNKKEVQIGIVVVYRMPISRASFFVNSICCARFSLGGLLYALTLTAIFEFASIGQP